MTTDAQVAAFAGIAGAAVGGLFAWLSARTGVRWEAARKEIVRLAKQVASYHRLEGNYCERLAVAQGVSPATLKITMRDEIEAAGLDRPECTESNAKKILADWG